MRSVFKATSMSSETEAMDLSMGSFVDVHHGANNNVTPEIIGIENVPGNLVEQYKKNYKTHRVGITHEEMVNAYTEWAKSYDEEMCVGCYNGPVIATKEISKFYPPEERPGIKILDVAAGTGRVGEELIKNGFKIIDALEPSRGMLDVLVSRRIYSRTFEQAVGYKPVAEILADSYDALVVSGGMGEGHIPVRAIDEFLRIVRPGGMILIVMREEYLSTVKAYSGKLEPFMELLVDKGLWIRLQRTLVANYSFNKKGVVYIYQKME